MKSECLLLATDGINGMWELLFAASNPFERHPSLPAEFTERIAQTSRASVVGDVDTLRCLSQHVLALRNSLTKLNAARLEVDKEERLHSAAEASIAKASAAQNKAAKDYNEIVKSGDQQKTLAASSEITRTVDAYKNALIYERKVFFKLNAVRYAFWRDCLDDLIALRMGKIELLAHIRRELQQDLATPVELQEALWAEDALLANTRESAAAEFAKWDVVI